MSGSTLLDSLDALVRADPAPSGFVATLAFGVDGNHGTQWWRVQCGSRADGAFVEAPSDCDAWLRMGTREAEAILSDGRIPDQVELLQAGGERTLLERFVRRYVAVIKPWDRT